MTCNTTKFRPLDVDEIHVLRMAGETNFWEDAELLEWFRDTLLQFFDSDESEQSIAQQSPSLLRVARHFLEGVAESEEYYAKHGPRQTPPERPESIAQARRNITAVHHLLERLQGTTSRR